MLTEEQLRERLSYVTGSDMAVICELNPWMTPYELWLTKTGRKLAEDISHKPAVKAGIMLEGAVRDWLASELDKEITDGASEGLIVHPEHDFLAGNIDGRVQNENAIVEIKTARSEEGWGEPGQAIIPTHYLCQVAHYMAVTNTERCYVGVLFRGVDFRHYCIERDYELEGMLIERAKKFWELVKTDKAPDFTSTSDIVEHFKRIPGNKSATATADVQECIAHLAELKQQESEVQDRIKKIQEDVCMFMEDADTLIDGNGLPLATWKQSKDTMYFNKKQFAKEMPEIYEQYCTQKPGSRRFNLK